MATTTSKPCRPRKTTKAPTSVEEWGQLLTRAEKGSDTQVEAMLAMREAGASYSQIATAKGVVPMTARARVLKAEGWCQVTTRPNTSGNNGEPPGSPDPDWVRHRGPRPDNPVAHYRPDCHHFFGAHSRPPRNTRGAGPLPALCRL
jgi:hypothetical protein